MQSKKAVRQKKNKNSYDLILDSGFYCQKNKAQRTKASLRTETERPAFEHFAKN